jgi:uncharacterized cupredoxin-like copper-binding protein
MLSISMSPMRLAGPVALIAAMAFVLGACSGSAGTTATASATAAAVTAAPSVAAATPVVSPSTAAVLTSPAASFTPGTKAAPRLIHIDANDQLQFVPNSVVIAQGETVTFEITNVGTVEHEFMVGPAQATFADNAPTEVAGIKAGQTKTVTYTFKGPAPFAFACHAEGHFEHGMLGLIQIAG